MSDEALMVCALAIIHAAFWFGAGYFIGGI